MGMGTRTLADLIREESRRFEHYVYVRVPWLPMPCGVEEACGLTKNLLAPPTCRLEFEREDSTTRIVIKPRKGSRKRKPATILLWAG